MRYIDAPLLRDEDKDADGNCTDGSGGSERLFCMQDANFNVTALIGTDGTVAERYVYDAYGKATIYDATWANEISWASSVKNEVLYCGYCYDPKLGLYHVRNRYYHPVIGAWVQRDPIGYADGMSLYEYCTSSPADAVDPAGLYSKLLSWRTKKGTYYQWEYYDRLLGFAWKYNVRWGSMWFEADKDDLIHQEGMSNSHGTPELKGNFAKVANGVERTAAVAMTTVVVASVVLPGPDDVIMAGVIAKLAPKGISMTWKGGKWVYSKLGKELACDELRVAEKLAADVLAAKRIEAAEARLKEALAAKNKAMEAAKAAQKAPKKVFDGIKKAPNYPEGFKAAKNGLTKNPVKNKELLDKLREVEPGKWQKIYKDGYDDAGKKISIHYFESPSGKVFDVDVKPGWSN